MEFVFGIIIQSEVYDALVTDQHVGGWPED